jgi:hypothetical protein
MIIKEDRRHDLYMIIFGKSLANVWQIWQTLIYGQTAKKSMQMFWPMFWPMFGGRLCQLAGGLYNRPLT